MLGMGIDQHEALKDTLIAPQPGEAGRSTRRRAHKHLGNSPALFRSNMPRGVRRLVCRCRARPSSTVCGPAGASFRARVEHAVARVGSVRPWDRWRAPLPDTDT